MFLGSYYDAKDEEVLRNLQITHIVDATGEKLSQTAANNLGIAHMPVYIWDQEGADISEHFESVLSFIASATAVKGRILIHCRAGISRSTSLVLVHLLHSGLETSLRAAFTRVLLERPFICPNPSFRDQLREYEFTLLGSRSFEDDEDVLRLISSLNLCWSGIFTKESDFDRIPIAMVKSGKNQKFLQQEYPPFESDEQHEGEDSSVKVTKPKKPFLKRGEGKKGKPIGSA
eukprot:gene29962-37101_t